MVSMIVVFLLCHPTWTGSAFDLFLCQDLAEAGNRLVMDMTIECWSLTHIVWSAVLGGLMIVFWVLGIPLAGSLILFKNR